MAAEDIKKQLNKHECLDYIHGDDIDPDHHQIYLFGREDTKEEMENGEPGVEFRMANRFIKNIHYLSGRDSKKPILIHMKTCGGYIEEGMAIYDAILSVPNPVTIVNYTHARSMSSIIFQAANKRVMMPNSIFMYHEGDNVVSGTFKQVNSIVDFGKKFSDIMTTIYAERMKHSPNGKMKTWTMARIKDYLVHEMDRKEDVYLTAEETIALGLADEMFVDYECLTTYTKQQLGIK
jgi:ATP-dependent protease ClpP protease subunit